jgi:hypothetical protein
MCNFFRRAKNTRFPGLLLLLICVLVPPIVWRVLTSTPTASVSPAASNSSQTPYPVHRLYLSSLERFYGIIGSVVLQENASSANVSSSSPVALKVDDSRDSATDMIKLGAIRTGKSSFQLVYDSNRQKLYFYAVGTSAVRFTHINSADLT